MLDTQCVTALKRASPKLPWPLPSDGWDVEVARWPYEPTEQHNSGEWVYIIRVSLWEFEPGDPITEVSMHLFRIREDCRTKRRFDSQVELAGPELEVNRKARRPSAKLARALAEFVGRVREKAEKDRLRYERILEAQLW